MGPSRIFTRIPMQVGSELRIREGGELAITNPTIEESPALEAADAVLEYRFDAETREHVLRLEKPVIGM